MIGGKKLVVKWLSFFRDVIACNYILEVELQCYLSVISTLFLFSWDGAGPYSLVSFFTLILNPDQVYAFTHKTALKLLEFFILVL